MKKYITYPIPLCIILVAIIFAACSRNNSSILQKAEKLLYIDADSMLTVLDEINTPQELTGKEKADYWWLRSWAHITLWQSMNTDSLILYSLDYYKSVHDTSLTIRSYWLAGHYYKWTPHTDSAESMFVKGLELARTVKDTEMESELLGSLTNLMWNKRNYAGTLDYARESIELNNSHLAYYMAWLGSLNDSTKTAPGEFYIDNAIEHALQARDTFAAAHYMRNYASSLSEQMKYDEAIKWVKRTGEINDYYKDFGQNHIILAEIYLDLNELDSAAIYIDKASKVKRKSSYGYSNSELGDFAEENHLTILQAILQTKQGKRFYPKSIAVYNDSVINTIYTQNKNMLAQAAERHKLEQQNLELIIRKQRIQNILISTLALAAIAAILIYLYTQKRRRKFEEVEERTETLQRLLNEAQNVRDEKENNSMFFRKTLLQQLGIIRMIATSPHKQNQDLLRQIVDISNESVSTESMLKWDDLYPVIDSVYDNFHIKLKVKYGDILNEKEIQLCCLLRADFSTSEISTVMQQSAQTIYQRKSSIRKKTGMDEKADIITYLTENS